MMGLGDTEWFIGLRMKETQERKEWQNPQGKLGSWGLHYTKPNW